MIYRAIDNVGDTVEFFSSENRDLLAAKRFIRKRRIRSMLDFKSTICAATILSGIEMCI